MKSDPTIDAIREVRHQISESFNHDVRKLVEHYRKLQERHPERIFSRSVKKPDTELNDHQLKLVGSAPGAED